MSSAVSVRVHPGLAPAAPLDELPTTNDHDDETKVADPPPLKPPQRPPPPSSTASRSTASGRRRGPPPEALAVTGPALRLVLPPWARTALWWLLLGLELGYVLYMLFLGTLYARRDVRGSLLYELSHTFLYSEANAFLDVWYRRVAATCVVFGALYAALLLDMLYWTWHTRAHRRCPRRRYGHQQHEQEHEHEHDRGRSVLTFGRPRLQPLRIRASGPAWPPWGRLPWRRWPLAAVGFCWGAWNDVFGLQGRFFALGMGLREGTEVLVQSAQAYGLSQFVSALYINQSFGLLIFANCLGASVLQWALGRRHQQHAVKQQLGAGAVMTSEVAAGEAAALQRFASILVDVVLDGIWGLVLPFCLFAPRISQHANGAWVSGSGDVPADLLRKEVEQVLILSVRSYVWSFFPVVSTVANILKLRRLLRVVVVNNKNKNTSSSDKPRVSSSSSTTTTRSTTTTTTRSTASGAVPRSTIPTTIPTARPGYAWVHTLHALYERLLLLYGLGILGTSLHASGLFRWGHGTDTGPGLPCVHRVYPWWAAQRACSQRTVNCTAAGLAGTATEIAAVLEGFYAPTLTTLVLTDCPRLEIPPQLRTLQALGILQIHHSQLVAWPREAALTPLGALTALKLRHVALPPTPTPTTLSGLVGAPMPPSLEFLDVQHANMSAVLGDPTLAPRWGSLRYLYCDFCGLSGPLPAALGELRPHLSELSLAYNDLDDGALAGLFPETATETAGDLAALYLNGNGRLATLPAGLWGPALRDVYVEATGLTRAGLEAARGALELRVYAAHSPLCDDGTTGGNSASRDEGPSSLPAFVTCAPSGLVFE